MLLSLDGFFIKTNELYIYIFAVMKFVSHIEYFIMEKHDKPTLKEIPWHSQNQHYPF